MSTILQFLYAAMAALLPLLTILPPFKHNSWTRTISSSSYIPQFLSDSIRHSIDASATASGETELDFSLDFKLFTAELNYSVAAEYLVPSNAGCSHPIIETLRTLWHPLVTILDDNPTARICSMLSLACSLGLWGLAHSRDLSWHLTWKHLMRPSKSEIQSLLDVMSPEKLRQSTSRELRRTLSHRASSSSYITLACSYTIVPPRNYCSAGLSRSTMRMKMYRDLLTTDLFSVDMPGSFYPRAKSNLGYSSQQLVVEFSSDLVPILPSAVFTGALSVDPDADSFKDATVKSLPGTNVQNRVDAVTFYATDLQELNIDLSASRLIEANVVNIRAGGKIAVIPSSESLLSSSTGSDFNVSAASSLSVDLVRRAFDLLPAARSSIPSARIYYEDTSCITRICIEQQADLPNVEPQPLGKTSTKPILGLSTEPTVSQGKITLDTRVALDWGSNSRPTQTIAPRPPVRAMSSLIDTSPVSLSQSIVFKPSSLSQDFAGSLPTNSLDSSDSKAINHQYKMLSDAQNPITLAGVAHGSDTDTMIRRAGYTYSGDGAGSKSLSADSMLTSEWHAHPDTRDCDSTAIVHLRRGSVSTRRPNLPVYDIGNPNAGPVYGLDTPSWHLNPSTDVATTYETSTLTDLPYSVGVSCGSSGAVDYGQSHTVKATANKSQVEHDITYFESLDNSEAYVLEETVLPGTKIDSKPEQLHRYAAMDGVRCELRGDQRVNMHISTVPVVSGVDAVERATVAPLRLKRHASVVFGSTREPVGPSEDQSFGRFKRRRRSLPACRPETNKTVNAGSASIASAHTIPFAARNASTKLTDRNPSVITDIPSRRTSGRVRRQSRLLAGTRVGGEKYTVSLLDLDREAADRPAADIPVICASIEDSVNASGNKFIDYVNECVSAESKEICINAEESASVWEHVAIEDDSFDAADGDLISPDFELSQHNVIGNVYPLVSTSVPIPLLSHRSYAAAAAAAIRFQQPPPRQSDRHSHTAIRNSGTRSTSISRRSSADSLNTSAHPNTNQRIRPASISYPPHISTSSSFEYRRRTSAINTAIRNSNAGTIPHNPLSNTNYVSATMRRPIPRMRRVASQPTLETIPGSPPVYELSGHSPSPRTVSHFERQLGANWNALLATAQSVSMPLGNIGSSGPSMPPSSSRLMDGQVDPPEYMVDDIGALPMRPPAQWGAALMERIDMQRAYNLSLEEARPFVIVGTGPMRSIGGRTRSDADSNYVPAMMPPLRRRSSGRYEVLGLSSDSEHNSEEG